MWKASLEIKEPERHKNRRYYIDDSFFKFWFWFVSPHLSAISEGRGIQVYDEVIAPYLDDYMGPRFEEIAIEWVKNYSEEILGSAAKEAGQIWTGDFDIEVAGTLLNNDEFYGECKWWKGSVGVNILKSLEENIEKTSYGKKSVCKYRLIFSKSGFTDELKARAAKDRTLYLLSPEDLL